MMSLSPRLLLDVSPAELRQLPDWREHRAPVQRHLTTIATDTRRDALAGSLFVALVGANHDAHAYVREAVCGGAAAVVVQRVPRGLAADVGVYVVSDTRRALADLAQLKRRRFGGSVVAITGSAGKTSTKAFVGTLLGAGTYVNPGNWNNDIGVPLSILAAPLDAPAWILELGMNHAGEISYLTDLVRPDLGVLLPAGHAHVGNLGSAAAVIEAKAELATALGAPAELVVADRRYVKHVGRERAILVGAGAGADIGIVSAHVHFPQGTTIVLRQNKRRYELATPLLGAHWGSAVAAAWAVARRLGVSTATLKRRAAFLTAPPGRMQLTAYRGGWILDDSYNAGPESYLALLRSVRPWARRLQVRLLVGDMRELGREAAAWHDAVAAAAAALAPVQTVAVGRTIARALAAAGVAATAIAAAPQALTAALRNWQPGTLLVAKGANASGIHEALRAFKEARCSTC